MAESRILRFARDLLHLDLTAGQAELLSSFEASGCDTGAWPCGRRGGKSMCADILALFDACMRDELRQFMRPGEARVSAIICPRIEQAREHIRKIRAALERSPELWPMLESETADELRLTNGSVIRSYPASARGLRGDPFSSCTLDELGHFLTSEDGNAAGDMVLEAVDPARAQFGSAGWLIAASTPLWKQGAFWKLCQRAESGQFPNIHYRHMSTAQMNSRISSSWLEQKRREDPDLYRREYLAQWIDGASSFLPSDIVRAAVRTGQGTLPPRDDVRYRMALDPAFSLDAFAAAVAHLEDGRLVVDGCWSWRKAEFDTVMGEVVDLARAYRVGRLITDQASPEPIRSWLQKKRIAVNYKPWSNESKRDAFSQLKVGLNTGAVELPDDEGLIDELIGLEARPTPSGMTRIAAAGSGHDDLAVAVAALAAQLGRRRPSAQDARGLLEAQEQLRGLRPEPRPSVAASALSDEDALRARLAGVKQPGEQKRYEALGTVRDARLGTRLEVGKWPWEGKHLPAQPPPELSRLPGWPSSMVTFRQSPVGQSRDGSPRPTWSPCWSSIAHTRLGFRPPANRGACSAPRCGTRAYDSSLKPTLRVT